MIVDELQEVYDNLQFFNEEMVPIESEWNKVKDNDELRHQLVLEALFVNRLNTIAKNHEWIEGNKDSLFKQKLFKKVITDPTTETDEYFCVKGYGTKMTNEEWDAYEQLHYRLFILEKI